METKHLSHQNDGDLADTLIAISVVSKLLARKIQEEDHHGQNETSQDSHH